MKMLEEAATKLRMELTALCERFQVDPKEPDWASVSECLADYGPALDRERAGIERAEAAEFSLATLTAEKERVEAIAERAGNRDKILAILTRKPNADDAATELVRFLKEGK